MANRDFPETYISWRRMRTRCRGPYAEKGITIDPSWDKFPVFLRDMGERPPGMTLGREDNNGPYCKGNCRWETGQEQSSNRSTTPSYGPYVQQDRGRWRVIIPHLDVQKYFATREEACAYRDDCVDPVTRQETRL